MKTLNIIASQQAYYERTSALKQQEGIQNIESVTIVTPQTESQTQELLRLIKLYRAQEEAFFDTVKRGEFSKDEKHHMMKTRKLLDNLLIQFSL